MSGADFIAAHVPQNATYRLADFPAQLAWHPSGQESTKQTISESNKSVLIKKDLI